MDIVKVVKHYIQSDKQEGALLINGEWGIGKSTYWREKIVPEIENIKVKGAGKHYKCLYVSLNGIQDVKDIFDQLAFAKLPWLKSKTSKIAFSLGSVFLNILGKIPRIAEKSGNQSTDVLNDFKFKDFFDFQNNVLCFDDFERMGDKLSASEVLGFINTHFIETNKIKTVIIINEKEVKDKEDYGRIKEKVINRTILFTEHQVELEEVFNRYSEDKNYYSFLIENQSYIQSIMLEYKEYNLRIIIFALGVIKTVFDNFSSLNKETDLARSVFFISFLISFEFKSARLNAELTGDYLKLDGLSTEKHLMLMQNRLREIMSQNGSENAPKEYALVFYDRYRVGSHPEYYFFKAIYNYILSGEMDIELLLEEIKNCQKWLKEQDRKNPKPLRQVLIDKLRNHYYINSDRELNQLIGELLQFVGNGDYFFYEYISIYSLFKELSDHKLLDHNLDFYKGSIIEGLKKSLSKTNLSDWEHLNIWMEGIPKTKEAEIDDIIGKEFYRLGQEVEEAKITSFFCELSKLSGPVSFAKGIDPFDFITAEQFFERIRNFEIRQWRNVDRYFAEYIKIKPEKLVLFASLLEEYKNGQSEKTLQNVLSKLIARVKSLEKQAS